MSALLLSSNVHLFYFAPDTALSIGAKAYFPWKNPHLYKIRTRMLRLLLFLNDKKNDQIYIFFNKTQRGKILSSKRSQTENESCKYSMLDAKFLTKPKQIFMILSQLAENGLLLFELNETPSGHLLLELNENPSGRARALLEFA